MYNLSIVRFGAILKCGSEFEKGKGDNMKSFKFNKILSIILCFVMIVSLFACGDNVETTAEGKETTSESSETVESESSLKTTTAEETVTEKETFTDANGETNAETDTTIGTTDAVFDSESVTESLAESAGVTFTEEVTETEQGCDTVAPEKEETTTESETETQSEEEITTEESATDETDEMDRFELFIGDGYADIITPTGLPYRATGYKSIEAEGFIFVSGLNFDFGKSFEPAFNRFTVSYYSSAPVKITLSYTIDGAEIEDCFYLEEGKQSFSGLIIDFLNGKQAASLTTIRVDTCEQKLAEEFLIFDLYTELIDVPERDYYISGSRYTLGIDLGWGGTINYVSDNKCNIDGVENMINKHDPGRLVQQSYYGTGAIEGVFEWGSFNGSNQWPYNPVQGGGKGGYASRIIDFVVEDNYVYVKAQPLDWGKINYITPSYMEN